MTTRWSVIMICLVAIVNGMTSLRDSVLASESGYPTKLTIKNSIGSTQTFNFKFLNDHLTGYQDISAYQKFCTPTPSLPLNCQITLHNGKSQTFVVKSDQQKQASVIVTVGATNWADGPCPVTNMEIDLHGNPGNADQDSIDVSYVNGFNYGVIVTETSSKAVLIDATSSKLDTILKTEGVFPPGCDICTPSTGKNAPIWPGCPATPYGGKMPDNQCKKGSTANPSVPDVPCIKYHKPNSDYTFEFVTMRK